MKVEIFWIGKLTTLWDESRLLLTPIMFCLILTASTHLPSDIRYLQRYGGFRYQVVLWKRNFKRLYMQGMLLLLLLLFFISSNMLNILQPNWMEKNYITNKCKENSVFRDLDRLLLKYNEDHSCSINVVQFISILSSRF